MRAEDTRAGKGSRAPGGFTLVEVIVVVAVLALLAGLVIPAISGVTDDAKVSKILAVFDTLKKGVDRHYAHTSTLATETSAGTDDASHELSVKQATLGWRGPYLDHPLTKADNPFGGNVLVLDSFDAGGAGAPKGFDLLGPKKGTVSGAGQLVQFLGVPEAAAKAVDEMLDNGVAGPWESTGRVEYVAGAQALNLYLLDV